MAVRDERNNQRYYIDDEIFDHYLSKIGWQGLLVYNAIARMVGKDQNAWPSIKTMGEKVGVSENTIRKGLRLLEQYGLIKIVERHNDDGGRSSNLYVLQKPPVQESDQTGSGDEPVPVQEMNPKVSHSEGGTLKALVIPMEPSAPKDSASTTKITSDLSIPETQLAYDEEPPNPSEAPGIKTASKEEYGDQDVNAVLTAWREATGLPIRSRMQANRRAAKTLVKQYGLDGVAKLLRITAGAQQDRYAPRIGDLCALQAKQNDLLVWANAQAHGSSTVGVL